MVVLQNHLPLAVRMRPGVANEIVGQKHILQKGSPLLRLMEPPESAAKTQLSVPGSIILWGPAGCGKTTIAYLVSKNSGRHFEELSAVSAGVKEVRDITEAARKRLVETGEETVLFIDEIHRFSKNQQDALLPSVENRFIILIGATTENPYFSIINPLLSRSIMLTLQPLEESDIRELIDRALVDERGFGDKVKIDDEAREMLIRLANGDARKTLTILEAAAGVSRSITIKVMTKALDTAAIKYDRQGDQHYDIASAFIKSMRGSDVDAALHYLARMIVAGEDPKFIARRIMIAASEEVSVANPQALLTAVAAAQATQMIGFPEARLILAQAVVEVAMSPKSNATNVAIDHAIADVQAGKDGPVPMHLRDAHYTSAKKIGHGLDYIYAHDEPYSVAKQQYLPDELADSRYYFPKENGEEKHLAKILPTLKKLLGRKGF